MMPLCAAALCAACFPLSARADHETRGHSAEVVHSKLEALAHGQLRQIAREPILIETLHAQNRETRALSAEEITRLDGDWRREVYTPDMPNLIPMVMDRPASIYLRRVAELSDDLYTEFLAMDARGLNFALSKLAPNYWQGGHEMFSQTFLEGLRGLYIGDVEYNPVTSIHQRRVAITIADPRSLMPLGVLCAGVNLAKI